MLTRWLAVVCLLLAAHRRCRRRVRTPSISASASTGAPRSINFARKSSASPAIASLLHLRRPAARARFRSARDAGAGAIERDQRRRSSQGSDAARCRCCCRSMPRPFSPTADRRADLPLSRYQSDFRTADFFEAGPSGYDAVFSLRSDAGDGLPTRMFARPVEVQITGSILTYNIDDPLGGKGEPVKSLAGSFPTSAASSAKAMSATPSPASACPMSSRSCASTGAAAAAAGLPRGLSGRRAFPEGAARRRRQPSRAAPRHCLRNRRTAGRSFTRFHLSSGRRHHRALRLSQARRPRRLRRLCADPLSAGESARPLVQLAIASRRRENPDAAASALSVAGQFLRSPQLRGRAMRRAASAIRARISARAPCPPNSDERQTLAIPKSRPSSPSATAC